MPSLVVAIKIVGSLGFIRIRFTVSPALTKNDNPVVFQVIPPSIDFKTPIEYVSPASTSPVARYIIFVLTGFIARSEQPITAKSSVFVDHVLPPSVDFHNPPEGAPAKIVLLFPGKNRIKFILPAPPSVGI